MRCPVLTQHGAISRAAYPVLIHCYAYYAPPCYEPAIRCPVGDVDGVVLMLRKNVNVNSVNYDGQSALHVAAAKGHHKVQYVLRGAMPSPVLASFCAMRIV
eukprot:3940338-Rhodomonas_salina.1